MLHIDYPLHPFLSMGCWNTPGAGRDAVTAAIQARPERVVVLTGDNLYPTKSDGERFYNEAVLREGAARMRGKDIYAAYGNHNLDAPSRIADIESSELEWTLPSRYYAARFSDNYALVVLNNNIMHSEEPELQTMLDWFRGVQAELARTGTQYYLVQHVPLVSFKKGSTQTLPFGNRIVAALTHMPIAILCADTHNYQYGHIVLHDGRVLYQHVVGTGGARPDALLHEDGDTHELGYGTYKMVKSRRAYGYLRVDVGSTEFIQVLDWELDGGAKRRSRRHTRRRHRPKHFACKDRMEAIYDAIKPICTTKDSLEEAAMNIYLTMMDVRPACLPFDTEGHDIMLKRFVSNPEVETRLLAIPNLNVHVGPYFDSGTVIVVSSKNSKEFVEPRLKRLEEIARVHGKSRGDVPELHILIGELLGYICPADMETLWKQPVVDDYSFVIDGRDYMPVWCMKDPAFQTKARALLDRMNKALEPLGKHAELVVKEKRMASNNAEGGGKRTRRRTRRHRSRRKRAYSRSRL